ncbi:HAD-IA family hydrolase [Candidatus Woesearchaeota archaeon]|nr:HAD-IA family hydrolase [Candidatus Woesearchaeota archaeon]
MVYTFTARGHRNILATHKNTLEFTKDREMSPDGDCILGLEADFSIGELQKMARSHSQLLMRIKAGGLADEIEFTVNKNFSSEHELVIRFSEFSSDRTFGFRATKSARQLDRDLVEKLKDPGQRITIEIEPLLKAAIFDFDDTIADLKAAIDYTHQNLAKALFERHGVYGPTTVRLLYDIDRMFSIKGVHSSPSNYDRHIWFEEYFRRTGIQPAQGEVEECVQLYWKHMMDSVKPMQDAQSVLQELRKEYKIAVITDSDGDRNIKIERAKKVGLLGLIDVFIMSDDMGVNKPDNRFYDAVFAKLKVKANECIMVGDKPQVDLKLAKELGMKTVWMKHGSWAQMQGREHFEYVDYEITSMNQLLEIIKDI